MSQSQGAEATQEKPLTEIEELRHLLIGRETEVLADLRKRLDDPGLRAEELASVLVQTIRISQANGEDLAGAIEAPVQECIKQSIEKDTQFFADALFPIMGPAIRRAINESLKSLVQSINAAVENNLSPQSLSWRWEAKKTGVPYGEIVLKHTLVYRVEQVLLVQRDTGLLVQHIERPDIESKDGDAVSAMLTAIQDFVRDSFAPEGEQGGDLGSVSVGEQTVWLVNSPSFTMACVIRGIAPVSLRVELQTILEDILRAYPNELNQFEGDRETMQVLAPDLERCFGYTQTKSPKQEAEDAEFVEVTDSLKTTSKAAQAIKGLVKKPALYIFLLLVALVVFIWVSWVHSIENAKKDQLLQVLEDAPGVLVTNSSWKQINWYHPERLLRIEGLQDESFSNADKLAKQQLDYEDENIDIRMQPYLSLDNNAQLQRAEKYLQPPKTVQLHLKAGLLSASGSARPSWFDQWQGRTLPLPNIHSIDLSELQLDLQVEQQAFDQLRSALQAHVFYFTNSRSVADDFAATGESVVEKLRQLHILSKQLGQNYAIQLTAYSDHVGGEALNASVRRLRGERVRDLLQDAGVVHRLMVKDGGPLGDDQNGDVNARRVNVAIILEPSATQGGGEVNGI